MTRTTKKTPTRRGSSFPLRRPSPQRTSLKNRTTRNPQTGAPRIIPKTRGFKFLSGDINWKEYGGTWYKSMGNGLYYILEFLNIEYATGDPVGDHRYCVIRTSIDLSPGGWALKQILPALKCIGAPTNTRNTETILYGIHSYSGGDQESRIYGNNANALLAEGKQRL